MTRIFAPLVGLFCLCLFLLSCTETERARYWGGEMKIVLPCDQKLFSVSWKEASLWYATRPMNDGERAETYTYTGVDEGLLSDAGSVLLIENRCGQ